jgi:hypothetical protein
LEDVKTILVDILKRNLNVTKDDGVTPATIQIMTKWYDDQTMSNCDGIVTVGTIDDTMLPSGLGDPSEDHVHATEINVWTATKYDSTGKQVVTDDIMRWKLVQQVSYIVKANAHYPLYSPWGTGQPSDYPVHYNPLMPSGIHTIRLRVWRELDDPTHTPYPLRRTQTEIESHFELTDLLSFPYPFIADSGQGIDSVTVTQ